MQDKKKCIHIFVKSLFLNTNKNVNENKGNVTVEITSMDFRTVKVVTG